MIFTVRSFIACGATLALYGAKEHWDYTANDCEDIDDSGLNTCALHKLVQNDNEYLEKCSVCSTREFP